jgi:hypothetical protein
MQGTYIKILVTLKQCQLHHRIFLLEQQRTVNDHYKKREQMKRKIKLLICAQFISLSTCYKRDTNTDLSGEINFKIL